MQIFQIYANISLTSLKQKVTFKIGMGDILLYGVIVSVESYWYHIVQRFCGVGEVCSDAMQSGCIAALQDIAFLPYHDVYLCHVLVENITSSISGWASPFNQKNDVTGRRIFGFFQKLLFKIFSQFWKIPWMRLWNQKYSVYFPFRQKNTANCHICKAGAASMKYDSRMNKLSNWPPIHFLSICSIK